MPESPRHHSAPRERDRLKIGLLLDSERQFWNVHALVKWAGDRDDLAITHLLILRNSDERRGGSSKQPRPAARSRGSGGLSEMIFSVVRKLESLFIRRMTGDVRDFGSRDVSRLGPRCIDLFAARPIASARRDSESRDGTELVLDQESLSAIRELELDLVVRIGRGSVCQEILATAKLGAVSVEHDGELVDNVATAAFWDTFLRRDTTGYMILGHSIASSEQAVLSEGRVRNRFSFLFNQVVVHKKSLFYLKKLLSDIALSRQVPGGSRRWSACDLPNRMPNALEQTAYLLRFFRAACGRVFSERVLRKSSRWGVYYSCVGWMDLDMRRATRIENPKGAFLADPFVLEHDGRTFCFAEELSYEEGRGCIAAYELTESGAIRVGRVITEPFHMSFPYVFRNGSAIYMVPETSENRDIRVYECVKFPDQWKLRKTLMTGVAAADTMIFERAGRWWLFTNLDPAETGDFCSELHIFHSDDPLSDRWIPHPMNPVLTDARKARNGGILSDGASLYRVSQRQGFDTYGSDFAVNRIDVLTPDDYAESASFERSEDRFNKLERVHHVHSNGRFSVFDHCRFESTR